ncbi:hypothetical protein PAXINDRAFT_17182 [Paxillus involutus ATCC 200175]|uniref:Uncharacterized protein n=1 Tax=Paxillus involutus ATCC 200175 TaxID=664439 RepID=A0A0C9TPQ8_PAXIN|nr:hypothetical protein PAXINDRAFT_17182 [Paxillus involutus ATCC 200175]
MLINEAGGKMIRFARSIFEERKNAIRDSPPLQKRVMYLEDLEKDTFPENESNTVTSDAEPTEEMDEETKHWPINAKYQDELNLIKPLFRAIPLPLYKNNKFIEPRDVNDKLKNSLIEVHFSIHHTYIKKDKITQDSFQALIHEIKILKGKKIMTTHHDP